VPRGATTLTVHGDVPVDWLVGDELLLPRTTLNNPQVKDAPFSTAEQKKWVRAYAESERVKIAAIEGNVITLAEPAKWDHVGAVDRIGTQVVWVPVANLTREIVFESENPAGVRGHFVAFGNADVNLAGVAFKDFGRTTIDQLHSTLMDSQGNILQLGTNQIGRYPVHLHHVCGPMDGVDGGDFQAVVSNCVVDGGDVQNRVKWGIVLHRASWCQVSDNVVFNFGGGGIVEEDGCERSNTYERNFVCQSWSRTLFKDEFGNALLPEHEDITNPARESDERGTGPAGFWFARSYDIRCKDNLIFDLNNGRTPGSSWNPDFVGSAYWVSEALHYSWMPTERGQEQAAWTSFKESEVIPPHWSIEGGEVCTGLSTTIGGLQTFDSFCTVRNLVGWNTPGCLDDYWMKLDAADCQFYGSPDLMLASFSGVHLSREDSVYRRIKVHLFFNNRVRVGRGIKLGQSNFKQSLVEDIETACATDFAFDGAEGVADSEIVIRRPVFLDEAPAMYRGWVGKTPPPARLRAFYTPPRTSEYHENTFTSNVVRFEEWDGKNYLVYGPMQFPAFVIPNRPGLLYSGKTNQQNWDEYGKAVYGAMIPEDAVQLPQTSGVWFKEEVKEEVKEEGE
jgi:hypothetical protein